MDYNTFGDNRDRKKRRRVVLQVLLIAVAVFALTYSAIMLPVYQPEALVKPTPTPKPSRLALDSPPATPLSATPTDAASAASLALLAANPGDVQREQGFVAISYVGVGTKEGETVISDVRLKKHLAALHARGFVTITQQDIYDFFYAGKALPPRALFLFFEDGRMQSAKLAHPMLKQFNYTASMLSYANNIEQGDPLFLTDQELLELERTGHWEVGTNGYRLSYINVFDRHKNFLGELTPLEYYYISPYVRRDYNHYLMDFIRDKNDIPIESYEQMKARVEEDYRMMDSVYTRKLGKLPGLYVLMHSNTGQFATNATVSAENDKWIRNYFSMNFNREMLSINKLDANIFDLTRMQPQSYWSVNHLLMRIYDDMGQIGILPFELGNLGRAAQWNILQGAAEWDGNMIHITSLPEGEGRIRLAGSETRDNFTLQVVLDGNKLGKQSIEILSDPVASSFTAIELEKNMLRVFAGSAGTQAGQSGPAATAQPGDALDKRDADQPAPLWELDLDKFDGIVYQTWEENRQEAMAVEIDRKLLQTYLPVESKRIAADLMRAKADTSRADNSPYIPEISLKDDGSRLLKIQVHNGYMDLWVDGKPAATGIALAAPQGGGIALRSAWVEYGYSQRNLADDVYEADFSNLLITGLNESDIILDYRGEQEAPKATELPPGYSGSSDYSDASNASKATTAPVIAKAATPAPSAAPSEKPQVGFFDSVGDWFKRLLHL
ncbi:MAG: glycoside hydrolase [Christensenellales bacterium]